MYANDNLSYSFGFITIRTATSTKTVGDDYKQYINYGFEAVIGSIVNMMIGLTRIYQSLSYNTVNRILLLPIRLMSLDS